MESYEFFKEIEDKLFSITSPVLWIKATPGAIIREETAYRLRELKEKLPKLVIKDFGPGLHYLQEDDPEKISCIIVEWLRTITFEDMAVRASPSEVEEVLQCC